MSFKALVVDASQAHRLQLCKLLNLLEYETLEANDGSQAVELYERTSPDIIFISAMLPGMNGYEATRLIKKKAEHLFVPVIFLVSGHDEESFQLCIEAGGDDFLFAPYQPDLVLSKLKAMQRLSALTREVQGMYSRIHREQEIAEQVFNRAVQKTNIQNQHIKSVILPASIFSGDMILSEYSPAHDIHFLIGDFTGHGLSAALGAMPVSEVFRAMTSKGFTPQEILQGINKKLRQFLPVGMFLCVQLVVISHNLDQVSIFNAGMPDLLIVDRKTRQIKHHVKSNCLPLGIIDHIDADEVGQTLPLHAQEKLIIYSDGLTEACAVNGDEFGGGRLENAILSAPGGEIFTHILKRLDEFCGTRSHADDVTLIEINCVPELLPARAFPEAQISPSTVVKAKGNWDFAFTLKHQRLRETNPVPIIINQVMEMEDIESERQLLFTVMTELYVNALDHGVLGLDSSVKLDAAGFAGYFRERELRLSSLDRGQVTFQLSIEQIENKRSIAIRVEDSGSGFDYTKLPVTGLHNATGLSGRGLLLLKELCDSVTHIGRGNITEARYSWRTG